MECCHSGLALCPTSRHVFYLRHVFRRAEKGSVGRSLKWHRNSSDRAICLFVRGLKSTTYAAMGEIFANMLFVSGKLVLGGEGGL
jgi:hypothetical protein